ncbi:MAG: SMI1/KNR4 family protein [Rubripirellula sp.]
MSPKPVIKDFMHLSQRLQSVDVREIQSWESRKGLTLPDDFKELLLASNGGLFRGDCFLPYPDEFGDEIRRAVRVYGIGHDEIPYTIGWAVSCFPESQDFPKNLLPVVEDDSGCCACLEFETGLFTRVVYWGDDTAFGEQPFDGVQSLPIASTFSELWDSIHQ